MRLIRELFSLNLIVIPYIMILYLVYSDRFDIGSLISLFYSNPKIGLEQQTSRRIVIVMAVNVFKLGSPGLTRIKR